MIDENLKRIADHYGLDIQTLKLIEEMAELTQALLKGDYNHICEEMCDVEIVLEQVKYLGKYHSESFRPFKLNRQLKRIARRMHEKEAQEGVEALQGVEA